MENPRILLIEDGNDHAEMDFYEVLINRMMPASTTDRVKGSKEALALLRSNSYDLLIMKSLNILKILYAQNFRIPVIFDAVDPNRGVEAFKLGVRAYFLKPMTLDGIADLIQNVLSNNQNLSQDSDFVETQVLLTNNSRYPNRKVFEPIQQLLKENDITTWLDKGIRCDYHYMLELDEALNHCQILVLCLTGVYLSDWTKMLIENFLTEGKLIIPILFPMGKLPAELVDMPSVPYNNIEQLPLMIKRHLKV